MSSLRNHCFVYILLLASATASLASDFASDTFVFGADARWMHIDQQREFFVEISDQVSNGCWTNSEAVKNSVELELTRSGYLLSDKSKLNSLDVYIKSVGFGVNERTCAVSYNLSVSGPYFTRYVSGNHRIEALNYSPFFTGRGITTQPKGDIDQKLRETFVNLIQEFLVEIPRQQKKFLQSAASKAKEEDARLYWSKKAGQ